MPTNRNVRFWAYGATGNAVKITLKPNQALEHWQGGPHDEGWHTDAIKWWYDAEGMVIQKTTVSDGQDCDGRLTKTREFTTPVPIVADVPMCYEAERYSLQRLLHTDTPSPGFGWRKGFVDSKTDFRPEWKEGYSEVYDQYARMANY